MIRRGSAHYRLSLAGGGTDFRDDGLCITLALPWKCHVTRIDSWSKLPISITHDDDWGEPNATELHPILGHLPHVERQHGFFVQHELPTRVGLGSSAALALAACENVHDALGVDRAATGAGWQDVWGCLHGGFVAFEHDGAARGLNSWLYLLGHIALFSTGSMHTEDRNAAPHGELVRQLALKEAHRLRDNPTLETLSWCMASQWDRKRANAPASVLQAIDAARYTPGFMAAKSTGSRGAGFGVVLTKDRERTRDALVECGARVWIP